MASTFLHFVLVTKMLACFCSNPSFDGELDLREIQALEGRLMNEIKPLLEVKFVQEGTFRHSDAEIYGGTFHVCNPTFWQEFASVVSHGQTGDVVYNHSLGDALTRMALSTKLFGVEGLNPLSEEQIKSFFPKSQTIQWHIGPANYSLLKKVPGTVVLRPDGSHYALHFVPECSESLHTKHAAELKKLRAENQTIQTTLTHLEVMLASMAQSIAHLCHEQRNITFVTTQAKKEINDLRKGIAHLEAHEDISQSPQKHWLRTHIQKENAKLCKEAAYFHQYEHTLKRSHKDSKTKESETRSLLHKPIN